MVLDGNPIDNDQARTLNYALRNLGGGRQKDWMTDGFTPAPAPAITKRPRGRPPMRTAPPPAPLRPRPPSGQPAGVAVSATMDARPDWQPASNSTSPYLANTVAQHDSAGAAAGTVDTTPAVTVLPSPTPSEEDAPSFFPPTTAPQQPTEPTGPAVDIEYFDIDSLLALDTPPPAQQLVAEPVSYWYTKEDAIYRLNAFASSRRASPQHPRDASRLDVLQGAVEKQDWAYLTMHQYYCLLSANFQAVPLGLRRQPSLDMAVRMMQDVLDSNDVLSLEMLHFFAGFPYSIAELGARWPAGFELHGQHFLQFVAQSPNFWQLKKLCQTRKCPPVARELRVDLKILSSTFRRLLFTALLRSIWPLSTQPAAQGEFESQALAIFQQNEDDSELQETLLGDSQATTQSELYKWGSHLRRLGDAYEATLRPQTAHQHMAAPQRQLQPQSYSSSPAHLRSQQLLAQTHPPLTPAYSTMPPQATSQSGRGSGRGRPRIHPPQSSHLLPTQSRPQPIRPAPQQSRAPTLLPQRGWVQPQQRTPNPFRFSLHQALLRSPVLQAQPNSPPLYHFPIGFVIEPIKLSQAGGAIQKWTFTLNREQMASICKVFPGVQGAPEVMAVYANSRTVRLRSVKWPAATLPTNHTWAVADTAWIPHAYFTFNGSPLQLRKKVHNGKDLAVDLTKLVREGENVLEVAIVALSNDQSYLQYTIGVEILGVQSHDYVKQVCVGQNYIPAEAVVQDIKNKLAGNTADDDIAIVESNLTINLFDPFSASSICDIPVRSRACLHNDCFDLETFFQTRRRKGSASVPDLWRCPICNADARPQYLIVDGFLQGVREALELQGLPRTRAIIVQQDGSWNPKAEVRDPNGVSDDSPTPTVARALPVPAEIEIIDLSD